MSGETIINIAGNLTSDPELRFTNSGVAVANFTVASTPRKFNTQTNQWEDGDALFLRCNIWRQAAENVAETPTKGARNCVRAAAPALLRHQEGEKRTVVELEVDEVGPSLKYATAKVNKANRSTTNDPSPAGQGGNTGGGTDPWGSNTAPAAEEEPPF